MGPHVARDEIPGTPIPVVSSLTPSSDKRHKPIGTSCEHVAKHHNNATYMSPKLQNELLMLRLQIYTATIMTTWSMFNPWSS